MGDIIQSQVKEKDEGFYVWMILMILAIALAVFFGIQWAAVVGTFGKLVFGALFFISAILAFIFAMVFFGFQA